MFITSILVVVLATSVYQTWRRVTRMSGIRYKLAEKRQLPLVRYSRPMVICGIQLFQFRIWLFEGTEVRKGDVRDRADGHVCFPFSWGWDRIAEYKRDNPSPLGSTFMTNEEGAKALRDGVLAAEKWAAERATRQEAVADTPPSPIRAVA